MITRFLTDVTTSFNPFLHGSKTARLFLAFLPADARKTMRINTKLLPRSSREASQLQLKFSMYISCLCSLVKDGNDIPFGIWYAAY